jgi:hypothetical protein
MPFIDEMRWNADERRFEGTLLDPAGVYSLLMRDARFDHGNAGGLHNVGPNRVDFRSDVNSFGVGSLQVVFSLSTGRCHADVDRFDWYGPLNQKAGHIFLEVLPHFLFPWAK